MPTLSAGAVKTRLTAGPEIAFLDVREAGQFGEGHPFFAVNVPYSRLELDVRALVPRLATAVVLMDGGDGVAHKAARRLTALGYGDVSVLDGGAPGWAKAGFTLFKGVNLPSKAFGEIVEHVQRTPSLSARDLAAKVARGENLVILDGRSPAEYRRMTIPGARSCPNAELAHRLPALVPDPTTTVVVNCAGRTRSIIGAQSLRNAGVANPVLALRNGTQGWMLADLMLERGTPRQALPDLDDAAQAQSRNRGRALIARYQLPTIERARLTSWQADATRTTYLLDVRSEAEFVAGHLPGAIHAPGGQLVQATDQWVATRGARLVLCCDTGLRAATTAMWLRGMGHDAVVLDVDVSRVPDPAAAPRGAIVPVPAPNTAPIPALPAVTSPEAARLQRDGAVLLDLDPGMRYRRAHIEGARWAIRPRLPTVDVPASSRLLLVCEDAGVAALAALDLREAGHAVLGRLAESADRWRAAGLDVVASPAIPADADCIDYLFFVHDRHDGNLDAARGYLAWETGLMAQMDAQETGVLRPLT